MNQVSIEDVDKDFIGKLGLGVERPPAIVGKTIEGGVAAQSGLMEGDKIVKIDGEPVLDSLCTRQYHPAIPRKNVGAGRFAQ